MYFVSDCSIYMSIVPKSISYLLASVELHLNCAEGCDEVKISHYLKEILAALLADIDNWCSSLFAFALLFSIISH